MLWASSVNLLLSQSPHRFENAVVWIRRPEHVKDTSISRLGSIGIILKHFAVHFIERKLRDRKPWVEDDWYRPNVFQLEHNKSTGARVNVSRCRMNFQTLSGPGTPAVDMTNDAF